MFRIVTAHLAALWLTSVLALAAPPARAASLPYNDFEGVCTPAHLRIQPIAAPAPDRDGGEPDTRDCALPDGTAIRLRWVTLLPFPFGECGAAPPEYLDLWVDKRRVLTRYSISEGCGGLKLQSLAADGKLVRVCTYVPKDPRTQQDVADSSSAATLPASRAEGRRFRVACHDLPVDPSAPVDLAEYPGAGASPVVPPAKAVALQLLTQEDPMLCAAALDADGVRLARPARGVPIPWGAAAKPDDCGEGRHARFDFFNEGVDRDVYDWSRCQSTPAGDRFLVLPKGSPAPVLGDAHAAPPPGGRVKDLDRWRGDVFRFGDETYVLATPLPGEQNSFIWRPAADGTLHVECAWRPRPQL
jgi:hypothetical protein